MISAIETIPAVWSPADDAFFRLVAQVLPSGFLFGAGVLLASHDAETQPESLAGAPLTNPGDNLGTGHLESAGHPGRTRRACDGNLDG
jgi:hypothetical protein